MNDVLTTAWEALQLPAASLTRLSIVGYGALPSAFAVTEFAAGSVGAAALALSELIAAGTGTAPFVRVDRRLASLWFGSSIQPIGWEVPPPWDAIAGDYRSSDGWIRLHTNAPLHRAAAVRVLDCPEERSAVAEAVSRWSADDLEASVVAAGGCAAAMRTVAAWNTHPQGAAISSEPLIDVGRFSCAPTQWRPSAARPLDGLKILDLTRVLAGPIATRFLAGYGADVLRIDPPGWDEPAVAPDVTLGKRCARLDLERPDDRRRFEALLAETDVLVHGYRPGALDGLGYDATTRRRLRPDLIDVSLDAYGWTGPWKERRGFDSLVQMSAGIAEAGMRWKGADQPTPLPVQALDHAAGYLIAAAAIAGVTRRLLHDEASTSRLSLARTAQALIDAGPFLGDAPMWPARSNADLSNVVEATDWGPARRVAPPAIVDGAPMGWSHAASRLGSADARWAAGPK